MYQKNSPETIQSMFNAIAERYDRANAILSFSLHRWWNRKLVQELHPNQTLLDLCAGTGDIAFEYLKRAKQPCKAYLIDFSPKMLQIAKKNEAKIDNKHQIFYLEADVQKIPLKDELADCASMAYGIRNVKDPALCIKEVFRLLKPGGQFVILELTRPHSPLLRFGHRIYLKTLMPLFGKWLSRNKEAYQYLSQSIQTFRAEEIEKLMKEAGFQKTQTKALSGGIATLIKGQKG